VSYHEAIEELDKIESNYRLRDPQTAPQEIEKIVQEEMSRAGLNVAEIRKTNSAQAEQERKAIWQAAAKFRASRPETDSVNGFLPCAANENIVLEYMQRHGLDFTSPHDYEQAFLATRDRLISPKQSRTTSQRVRKVDGVEISHEALDRLSAKDLERIMQNPRVVEAINSLPPRR
jgi:hypothetical protein